jgi:hypothetical protein
VNWGSWENFGHGWLRALRLGLICDDHGGSRSGNVAVEKASGGGTCRSPAQRSSYSRSIMKPRQKRLALVVGGLAALGIAVALVLTAFQQNLVFFYSPTQVANQEAPQGGLSASAAGRGRQHQAPADGLTVAFNVTDTAKMIPGGLHGASCRTCSRKAKASSRRASSAPTACSMPTRCWPSTTRTTCRRRPRTRSSRRTKAQKTVQP